MQHESYFLNMKQEAEAELPLKKQAYQDAKTTILGIEDELATIDRAIEEVRARKRRIAGSRHTYLSQKAADLAHALLGGTSGTPTELPATEDAGSLDEAERILHRRRGEIVQAQVMGKSKVRTTGQDVFHAMMRMAAAEYELAREEFFSKWCKVTALSELAGTGPLVERERWEAIRIPSVTLSKYLRHVETAGYYGDMTSGSAASLVHRHEGAARFELED